MNSSFKKFYDNSSLSRMQECDVANVTEHKGCSHFAVEGSNFAERGAFKACESVCDNSKDLSNTAPPPTCNSDSSNNETDGNYIKNNKINQNGVIHMSLKKIMVNDEKNRISPDNVSVKNTSTTTKTTTTTSTAAHISPTMNYNNNSCNNKDSSSKYKKTNLKKKSFTLFSKSSKLKDFLMNKSTKKQAINKNNSNGDDCIKGDDQIKITKSNDDFVEGANKESNMGGGCGGCGGVDGGCGGGVNGGCGGGVNGGCGPNDDTFKGIFRLNKHKLSKLNLQNNKNNKSSKTYNNLNHNNDKDKQKGNDDNDDDTSRNSNSSNSIITPSPTTFSHTNHSINNTNSLSKNNSNNDDDNDDDDDNISNRPVSFDIKTRNLPEIPHDISSPPLLPHHTSSPSASRGGVRSADISQQQLSLQQHLLQHTQQGSQQQQSSSSSSSLPWQPNMPQNADNQGQVDADGNDQFIESFNELKNKGWYWGPLSWKEAEEHLKDKPIGSFLVRDSSDERYILSLSFKSDDQTHHTRIEHYRGQFSFNAQPRSHGAATIVDFIEKAIENCTDGSFSYFLRPKGPGLPPTMVRLTNPLSRLTKTHSLQHLCRFVVLSQIRRDLIETLPVPSLIKSYLSCNQYYVEGD